MTITELSALPAEQIKQQADETYENGRHQHSMKLYEICLGKLTAEDLANSNLALLTHLGICNCAHQLGLSDHLVHFATQGLELNIDEHGGDTDYTRA